MVRSSSIDGPLKELAETRIRSTTNASHCLHLSGSVLGLKKRVLTNPTGTAIVAHGAAHAAQTLDTVATRGEHALLAEIAGRGRDTDIRQVNSVEKIGANHFARLGVGCGRHVDHGVLAIETETGDERVLKLTVDHASVRDLAHGDSRNLALHGPSLNIGNGADDDHDNGLAQCQLLRLLFL
jgi:hypothetical protein